MSPLLTGLTADGAEVPLQVDAQGRLVALGLDGPASVVPGPPGPGVPPGGMPGDVLTKTGPEDLEADWRKPRAVAGLPSGGAAGDFLARTGPGEGQWDWVPAVLASGGMEMVPRVGDPAARSTVLSLHFEGAANSSAIFNDATSGAVVALGGAGRITTNDAALGASCLDLRGGTFLTVTLPPGGAIGRRDFALRLRIKRSNRGNFQPIWEATRFGSSGSRTNGALLMINADNKLSMFSGGAFRFASTPPVPVDQWVEIGFWRLGGVFGASIDGDAIPESWTADVDMSDTIWEFGRHVDNSAALAQGLWDELNMVVGMAREGGSYIVSGEPYADRYGADLGGSAAAGKMISDGESLYLCIASGAPGSWLRFPGVPA